MRRASREEVIKDKEKKTVNFGDTKIVEVREKIAKEQPLIKMHRHTHSGN